MKRAAWLAAGVVVVAVAAFFVVRMVRSGGDEPKFRKEKVDRGDVVQAVTASGTLSAVTTVQVGSQVSGIISAIHADYNSKVTKGQLLAELDPQPFQATIDQRRADIDRSMAELRDSERELARSKRLHDEGILSQGELDASVARHDSAAAVVRQGQAALRQAEVNLENTKITSPIDGIVVARQYDIGQTVAASFQAPTLFTIAQDLTRMQVLTNIDEADIGGVQAGQPATFTVDAFPDETFQGQVSQVRLSAQTVQNVVTYPVVIDVANLDGRLKPGMTADVSVPVKVEHDTLRVPNAALRFKPDASMLAQAAAPKGSAPSGDGEKRAPRSERGPWQQRGGGGAGNGQGPAGGGAPGKRPGTVYVEVPGGKLRAVSVMTSITDGSRTAIESAELHESDDVVTGLATTRASGSASQSRSPASGMGGGMGGGGSRGPRM